MKPSTPRQSKLIEKQPSFTILNGSNFNSRNEDLFKDSLENSSVNMSKENILLPDSLNNTEIIKNNFQDSLSSKIHNLKQCQISNEYNNKLNSEEDTKKIAYKYITNYPLNKSKIKEIEGENNKEKYFWFGAYGKLLKSNKVVKILNYYRDNKKTNGQLKQKGVIIKDFELSFGNDSRPYINYLKGGYIFVRLYYLTIEEINYIFNYINKIEYKFNDEQFVFHNNIGNNFKIEHNNINFPYNYLCCLGSFLNINIYSFTNLSNNLWKSVDLTKQFPKIKKVSKIVKYLIDIFSSYSIDFFIYYLLSDIHNNINNCIFNDKVNEIKGLLTKQKIISTSNNNTDSSIQSININNINLNVKVTNKIKSNKVKTGHVPKLNSNTQFSSMANSNRNELTMLSCNNNSKNICNKHSAVKSLNYSKQSTSYNQNFIVTKGNVNKTYGPCAKALTSDKRNNVYVVSRKLKSDVDFDCDDDSSINTKKDRSAEKKVFVTPKKSKIAKYYS